MHLAFAGLDTEAGGGGGIGSGILDPTSAGAGRAAGAKSGSNMQFVGFSRGVELTDTPALCRAMRGSLRVLVIEDTVEVIETGGCGLPKS